MLIQVNSYTSTEDTKHTIKKNNIYIMLRIFFNNTTM